MRDLLRGALQVLSGSALLVLGGVVLLVLAAGLASFGVDRVTAAGIAFGCLLVALYVVHKVTEGR